MAPDCWNDARKPTDALCQSSASQPPAARLPSTAKKIGKGGEKSFSKSKKNIHLLLFYGPSRLSSVLIDLSLEVRLIPKPGFRVDFDLLTCHLEDWGHHIDWGQHFPIDVPHRLFPVLFPRVTPACQSTLKKSLGWPSETTDRIISLSLDLACNALGDPSCAWP